METGSVAVMWEPYVEVPVKGDAAPIAAIEERMAVSLPEDVRRVIIDHAGEVTQPSAVIVGTSRETPFSPILYAGGRPEHQRYTYSVEFVLSTLQGWADADSLAELKLFPFASNSAGSYFCLDYRDGPSSPPIVFVDLDYDLEEEGSIKPVAENLQALLDKLH